MSINSNFKNVKIILLLCELRKYKKSLEYSWNNIIGISPNICTHCIHLEDTSKTYVEYQRRLNPNLRKVVKKEVLKLISTGGIYSISDSFWVSPVHVVPKK